MKPKIHCLSHLYLCSFTHTQTYLCIYTSKSLSLIVRPMAHLMNWPKGKIGNVNWGTRRLGAWIILVGCSSDAKCRLGSLLPSWPSGFKLHGGHDCATGLEAAERPAERFACLPAKAKAAARRWLCTTGAQMLGSIDRSDRIARSLG